MLYNVMKDGKNIFDHPKNSDLKIYENARRIATGQGRWLHNWVFVRAIQQINFTANLDRNGETTIIFIIEEAKKTVLDFSQGTAKFCKRNFIEKWFNFYQYKMTSYNSLNIKISNLQPNRSKSAIKYKSKVVLDYHQIWSVTTRKAFLVNYS